MSPRDAANGCVITEEPKNKPAKIALIEKCMLDDASRRLEIKNKIVAPSILAGMPNLKNKGSRIIVAKAIMIETLLNFKRFRRNIINNEDK